MGDAHMKILGDALSHGDLDALETKLAAGEDHAGIDRQESFRSTKTKGKTGRRGKTSRSGSDLLTAEEGGAGHGEGTGEPETEWDLLTGEWALGETHMISRTERQN